ncbi:hypothetical protein SOVF_161690 [Spinacia oleracea]|nr:hypothetical protein SOVF_161690 [Spinacia oleracea]
MFNSEEYPNHRHFVKLFKEHSQHEVVYLIVHAQSSWPYLDVFFSS